MIYAGGTVISKQCPRLHALSMQNLSRHVEAPRHYAMLDYEIALVSEGSPDGSSANLSGGCPSPCASGPSCGYSTSCCSNKAARGARARHIARVHPLIVLFES
ncbi:hypothetical protein PC128_g19852 [Phytophthora cactorum]|nr:hypothetical protein PC120_g15963 [Phytophthora cactorum]KAG3165878.1 hypothetical protein PC128_g19852 [Phytophthora cactorum]